MLKEIRSGPLLHLTKTLVLIYKVQSLSRESTLSLLCVFARCALSDCHCLDGAATNDSSWTSSWIVKRPSAGMFPVFFLSLIYLIEILPDISTASTLALVAYAVARIPSYWTGPHLYSQVRSLMVFVI